jgi:uncharacterized membrane protein YbhN (UPF0104 family)
MIVRLAITAVILALLATRIDMADSGRAVAAVSLPHLLLVLALVAVDRSIMILRWILLLRASGIAIPTADAVRLFLVSSFVGSFLPAGVGADAARAYGLTRANTAGSEAMASVVVDRLLGITSLVMMAFVGLVTWPTNQAPWTLPLIVGAAALACIAVFRADDWMRWIIPTRRHEGFLTRRVLRLTDAVGRYRGRRSVLFHVLAWSLAVQLLRITQAYILGVGLGMSVPFTYYLLFMPLALLLLLLPISISGFGLPQGGIVWMLQPMGVPEATSFALSTLILLTGLAGNLPGLFLWLRARNAVKSST